MKIITNTELMKILHIRIDDYGYFKVLKDLGIAQPYLTQLLKGERAISKKVAQKLGYQLVKQPRVERQFSPIENNKQESA